MRGAFLALGTMILSASLTSAQEFGRAVAIHEGRLLIAEPSSYERPSSVYVYDRSGTEWSLVDTWETPESYTSFARVGAMQYWAWFIEADEESMIIGGLGHDMMRGAAAVYRRQGDAYEFDVMLQPEGLNERDQFGVYSEFSGDLLFVSAPLAFDRVGAVWVYERDDSGLFSERQLLRAAEPVQGELFGWGMERDGQRLIVGSGGRDRGGAAHIFMADASGEWSYEARLEPPENGEPGDPRMQMVGSSGGLAAGWFGETAVLGLSGRDEGAGVVLAFDVVPGTGEWTLQTTLRAEDGHAGAHFGHTVQVVEDELWVSAPGADGEGAIYRFVRDPAGLLVQVDKIQNSVDPADGDAFGYAVSIDDDVAIIGQPGDDFRLGSAVVMRRTSGNWVVEEKLLIPDGRELPQLVGGERHCSESGFADQFDCSNIDILSFLPITEIGGTRGIATNDVWGWTDPLTGSEYALVGRTDGTAFVDISDPINPVYLGELSRTSGTPVTDWRDIKVFASYAFIVADNAGEHGMQVFDLSRLRDVTNPPVTFESDALYSEFASAHNLAVDEETGIGYVLGAGGGGETCGGGLHMVDLNDPTRPTFAGCFQDPSTGTIARGYTHDAVCVVYRGPDAEHLGKEICFGSNETALSIADVTDKENPVALSIGPYPNAVYAHQGWISEDHRYFYMNDEGDETESEAGRAPAMVGSRTLIWDIVDLDDPTLASEHFGEANTIDHNLYIRGNLMYQSNYTSGLRILDISDPENPVEVGFFDTMPWDESMTFQGSWSNYPFFESGTIPVTSMKEGIFFVRYRPSEIVF